MSIESSPFGKLPNGDTAHLFTLRNANGMEARITNFGGIIVGLTAPDRDGKFADVILGKDNLEGYLAGHPYFACITGRVAGRIGAGKFSIDGTDYTLEINDSPNALHGGSQGFHSFAWDAKITKVDGVDKLKLTTTDPSGSNGFPGTVNCVVTYALLEDNSLEITYEAETDRTTPFNITNHAYFNLRGEGNGDALGHEVQILSDAIAAVNEDSTLTGVREPVQSGFNDYRAPIRLVDRDALVVPNSDIHYVLEGGRTDEPRLAVVARDPESGRTMEVLTTEPGVQFYAAICLSLDETEVGKGGKTYPTYGGLCFETQDYADSVNFPLMGDAILRPGRTFTSTTLYRFKTDA